MGSGVSTAAPSGRARRGSRERPRATRRPRRAPASAKCSAAPSSAAQPAGKPGRDQAVVERAALLLAVVVRARAAGHEAEAVVERLEVGAEGVGRRGLEPAVHPGADAAQHGAGGERLAQDRVEAVGAPHREQRRGVAAADVDDVLLEDEAAQVGHRAVEEARGRSGGSRGREGAVEARDVALGVAAGGGQEAHARALAAGEAEDEAVQQRVLGLLGEAPAAHGDDRAAHSMPRRSSSASSPRQPRRTRTERSRCTRVPSSRSSSRRAAVPDRLDHPPAGADQDALLRLGLDPHERAHEGQAVLALLDLVDHDLDGVRDLLEGAPQHLLAHELGQQHLARLVGALLGREEERALGHAARPGGRAARRRRAPVRALTGKISSPTSSAAASVERLRACARGRGGRPC